MPLFNQLFIRNLSFQSVKSPCWLLAQTRCGAALHSGLFSTAFIHSKSVSINNEAFLLVALDSTRQIWISPLSWTRITVCRDGDRTSLYRHLRIWNDRSFHWLKRGRRSCEEQRVCWALISEKLWPKVAYEALCRVTPRLRSRFEPNFGSPACDCALFLLHGPACQGISLFVLLCLTEGIRLQPVRGSFRFNRSFCWSRIQSVSFLRLGEFSALACIGALHLDDALHLVVCEFSSQRAKILAPARVINGQALPAWWSRVTQNDCVDSNFSWKFSLLFLLLALIIDASELCTEVNAMGSGECFVATINDHKQVQSFIFPVSINPRSFSVEILAPWKLPKIFRKHTVLERLSPSRLAHHFIRLFFKSPKK